MILFFGIVTLVTAWLTSRASFFAIRCLLGLGEAATMPGLAYLLSRVSFELLVSPRMMNAKTDRLALASVVLPTNRIDGQDRVLHAKCRRISPSL
jgi:MFS family permease